MNKLAVGRGAPVAYTAFYRRDRYAWGWASAWKKCTSDRMLGGMRNREYKVARTRPPSQTG